MTYTISTPSSVEGIPSNIGHPRDSSSGIFSDPRSVRIHFSHGFKNVLKDAQGIAATRGEISQGP